MDVVIYYVITELIGATSDDYAKLDAAMVLRGFAKDSVTTKGKSYLLPRGVFRCKCRHHISEVLDMARAAAKSTGLPNEVMTIESAGARWFPNIGEIATAAAEDTTSD